MKKSQLAIVLVAIGVGGVALGYLGREWLSHAVATVSGKSAQSGKSGETAGQLWTCSMHPQVIQDHPGTCPICQMALEPLKSGVSETKATDSKERKVLYWTDPMMSPPYITDKPGKSPMGMDLVPVYADEHVKGQAVLIDPAVVQNIGLRVAPVKRGAISEKVRAVGYLTEPDYVHFDVNLRVSGWITKLHANVDGMPISKGDPLFDLYSPELQLAIEELIASQDAIKSLGATPDMMIKKAADDMVVNAGRKLELWGLQPAQIASFAKLKKAPASVQFKSPMNGHVTEKMVYEGAAVKAGDRVMRLADNSQLWLDVQVYEKDLPLVKKDAEVLAKVVGVKEPIKGKVIFFHPHVNPDSRSALVRVEIANPTRYLKQGMYGTAEIQTPIIDDALSVPREAIIDTGSRQIVYVSTGEGAFEPRDVKTGLSTTDGTVQILAGLASNETVVTSGQFLLDSESRLKEAIQKHLRDRLLAKQTKPATASAVTRAPDKSPAKKAENHSGHTTVSAEVQDGVDAVAVAYLNLAKILGAKQAENAEAISFEPLRKASAALEANAAGEIKALSTAVATNARGLTGKTLEEQRKGFGRLSDDVISLVGKVPTSHRVASKLYVVECTMAPGKWLQTNEKVANPYYANTMKSCGEVIETLNISGQ